MDPGSKFYGGGPYFIGIVDPGSIFHGVHILYDTGRHGDWTISFDLRCFSSLGCINGFTVIANGGYIRDLIGLTFQQ